MGSATQGYELLSPVRQCPPQVWASSFLPNEARLEDQTQRQHLSQHGVPMLLEYAEQEACRKVKTWMLLYPLPGNWLCARVGPRTALWCLTPPCSVSGLGQSGWTAARLKGCWLTAD